MIDDGRWTEGAKKVAEVALREALSRGNNYIGIEHIEAAIKRVRDEYCPHCGQATGR